MTTPDTDERHLAELRRQWHQARAAGDDELLAGIEDEAARIKALHCIRQVFPDAVVIEDSGTDTTEQGEHRDGPEPPRDPASDAGAALSLSREG